MKRWMNGQITCTQHTISNEPTTAYVRKIKWTAHILICGHAVNTSRYIFDNVLNIHLSRLKVSIWNALNQLQMRGRGKCVWCASERTRERETAVNSYTRWLVQFETEWKMYTRHTKIFHYRMNHRIGWKTRQSERGRRTERQRKHTRMFCRKKR